MSRRCERRARPSADESLAVRMRMGGKPLGGRPLFGGRGQCRRWSGRVGDAVSRKRATEQHYQQSAQHDCRSAVLPPRTEEDTAQRSGSRGNPGGNLPPKGQENGGGRVRHSAPYETAQPGMRYRGKQGSDEQ